MPMTSTTSDLPVVPMRRAAQCPLAPPAEFADWRQETGLRRAVWNGQEVWSVSRYQDIRAALVDPRLSAETLPDLFGAANDIVRDFGLPVPSLVIALLLGVPPEDLELFQHNSTAGLDVSSTDEQRAQGFIEMYVYIQELVARKEREPGDDLISRLITDYVATGQLDYNTVAVNGVIMMLAGHETTANMISLGTVALLEHPEIFERLGQTDDAAVIANAVEELLRYLSIVHAQVDRIATEDLVLGGQQIRTGDRLLMNLPAGNWDSEFVDSPETLDIARNARGHVAFGYGTHQCIGANLARVEMQVAFATLARRLPGLRLAVPHDELKFKDADIYGMKELPVTW
jgi:cytochrome P450